MPELPDGSGVTMGEFDGVHRGHRVVLSEVCQRAAVIGCPAVVVTFDRDPARLTSPASAPPELTDLNQRLELLASSAIDLAVVLPAEYVAPGAECDSEAAGADTALLRLIDEVVVDALGARVIVVGENFHFGERRRNTIQLLEGRKEKHGFEVVEVPVVARLTSDGDVISATEIRRLLDHGDVRAAQRMLGRPFEIRSIVASGDRRGRKVGFPTANLPVPEEHQIPADGVYAGWFWRSDGTRYPAAINIGRRPTFYERAERSLIEAHLIGFKGDIYGEPARLTFVDRLRAERKFAGVDELIAQLRLDISKAASLLGGPWG
jgi:riboflavin kinase/FMN adenylyltransferase